MRNTLMLPLLAAFGLIISGCSSSTKGDRSPASDPQSAQIENSSYVLDGGEYVEGRDDMNAPMLGGRNGLYLPQEKFVTVDREKNAPVGKILYVVTDAASNQCVKARFTNLNGKKVLLAYPKSPVPNEYCIYQKNFSPEGTGFSLFIKDGPVCRPSYSAWGNNNPKRKIASVEDLGHDISLSYCVSGTVSWGEMKSKLDKR